MIARKSNATPLVTCFEAAGEAGGESTLQHKRANRFWILRGRSRMRNEMRNSPKLSPLANLRTSSRNVLRLKLYRRLAHY